MPAGDGLHVAIVPGDTLAFLASPGSTQAAAPQDQAAKIPPDNWTLSLRLLLCIQTRC